VQRPDYTPVDSNDKRFGTTNQVRDHAGGEFFGLVLQPTLVGVARSADDGVEQPGVEASVLVAGQIDHDGHRPVLPDPAWPPDVPIDAESLHLPQPLGLSDPGLGFECRVTSQPHGCP